MNRSRPIRDGLAAAACALIGANASPVDANEFDASLLYYTEGSRVTVSESVFNFSRPLSNERRLEFSLIADVMTGASPNGATPARIAQTFTRPSGRGQYVVPAGITPLDDTFQDNRIGATAALNTPIGERATATAGAHFSLEYDYLSLGANSHLTRDFNKRNTTVALGAAISWDELTPEGGIPVPFASMAPPGVPPARLSGTDSKYVLDLLAGVTQVIDRMTVARINYSYSYQTGYLSDPFKMLSVVAGQAGNTQGDPVDYVFEHRPNSRGKHALYGMLKRYHGGNIIDVSYRHMRDNWGIRSHTAEARYRWQMRSRRYLEPQLRYYHQTGADFFSHFLRDDIAFPNHATADYRLGEFDAYTVAFKYGIAVKDRHEVNLRIGYYLQMGDSSPPEAIGSLQGLDLFPTLDAYIIQIGYSAIFE